MPRKGPAPRRPLVADPVYNSPLVTQLVNKVLMDGKRSIAQSIVYGALEGCRDKTGSDPVVTLKRALDNVKPALEVKSRRVGGATYQVPIEVKPGRSTTLALRWVVGYSKARREKTGSDPVVTLKRALDNVKPSLEVKSRRVGGATYQVPIEVKGGRSMTLALRWLVSYSQARREKTMAERLMNEILDASNGLGAAVKRREDTHKMAESNRAFAHYRW
jgi:small subunit ribosomal protein S7